MFFGRYVNRNDMGYICSRRILFYSIDFRDGVADIWHAAFDPVRFWVFGNDQFFVTGIVGNFNIATVQTCWAKAENTA